METVKRIKGCSMHMTTYYQQFAEEKRLIEMETVKIFFRKK